MLASLLRIILLTATLKILERGLDKGPIINKMTERMEETKQPDIKISQFIKQFHGISKQSRAKYLNMTSTYNIVTLLYVYNELVPIDAK